MICSSFFESDLELAGGAFSSLTSPFVLGPFAGEMGIVSSGTGEAGVAVPLLGGAFSVAIVVN